MNTDAKAEFTFSTGAASDTGRVRDHNEDSMLAQPKSGVWVVADGMGGHEAGDFASQTIVAQIATVGRASSAPDLQARFMERLTMASDDIRSRSEELGGATIGATLVALLVHEEKFACIWSGDSRIYLMRDGVLQQVTQDHTEVQELLNSGAITPQEAADWPRKNVITRAIGVTDDPNTDETYGNLEAGDLFLLCSDGLTEHIDDQELPDLLQGGTPQDKADRLIELTLERGAKDNVTVIVVECEHRARTVQPTTDPLDWLAGD